MGLWLFVFLSHADCCCKGGRWAPDPMLVEQSLRCGRLPRVRFLLTCAVSCWRIAAGSCLTFCIVESESLVKVGRTDVCVVASSLHDSLCAYGWWSTPASEPIMRANRSDLLTTLTVSFNGERWLLPIFLMLPIFILASDSSDAISIISECFSGMR